MKIEMLKTCGVDGKHCVRGDIVETSDKDAKYLIATGSAKVATEAPKPKTKPKAKPKKVED